VRVAALPTTARGGLLAGGTLGNAPSVTRALAADYGSGAALAAAAPGRSGRTLALAGAIVGGLVLAATLVPDFGSWLHWNELFNRGEH
jgi:hypothetical protein